MASVTEMKEAIRAAECELRKADMCVEDMVAIIVGRLKNVRYPTNSYGYARNLASLKRELKDFNITTKQWNAPEQN